MPPKTVENRAQIHKNRFLKASKKYIKKRGPFFNFVWILSFFGLPKKWKKIENLGSKNSFFVDCARGVQLSQRHPVLKHFGTILGPF